MKIHHICNGASSSSYLLNLEGPSSMVRHEAHISRWLSCARYTAAPCMIDYTRRYPYPHMAWRYIPHDVYQYVYLYIPSYRHFLTLWLYIFNQFQSYSYIHDIPSKISSIFCVSIAIKLPIQHHRWSKKKDPATLRHRSASRCAPAQRWKRSIHGEEPVWFETSTGKSMVFEP